MKSRLQEKFIKETSKELAKEFEIKNVHALPKLTKIMVNSGVSEALVNAAAIDRVLEDIMVITGQRPVVNKAKKAVSNFKVREGDKIGVSVTLRKYKMWSFLDRFINLALPRVKDFKGVSRKSFDKSGNITFGFKEQSIFPEIDTSKMDKLRGFEITIVVKNSNPEKTKRFLELLGMPFEK